MANKFYTVKEGEFVRQLEHRTITKVIAQESLEEPLKFVVVAINSATGIAYAMRHGRIDELRTWRLDNLAKFLKKHAVDTFEVQFKKK